MNTSGIRPPPVILMVLLLFSTQACTDIYLSGLPQIAREFGVSIGVSNLTISVYNYSQAFFVLFIGVVSELRGRRSVVLFCLLVHIVASAAIALCTALPAMIALRAAQALGSAAVYIVFRLVIKDTMDKQAQIHATGLLVVGLVLSPILAPVAGAWIIRVSSWRNCFWAIAGFELPLLAWAWLVVQESNHRQQQCRAAFSLRNHLLGYYSVLVNGYFLSLALIVGAAFAAFYAFISISSFMYIDQYGLRETDYAYLFIGIAVAYLLGNRVMSKLNAHNVAPQKIVGVGICVSVAAMTVILAQVVIDNPVVTIALVTAGTCLLRLATALINPPVQVMVTNHFQDQGAHALGLLTCIQYCFAGIGTMVVSGLAFAPSANFTLSTVLFVSLSLLGYLLMPRNRPHRTQCGTP